MTGTEILSYIEERMGIPIDSDKCLIAINEAIDMLGDLTLLYDTIDNIEVTDTTEWYNLPPEFTYVDNVFTIDNKLYFSWLYRNGQINFTDKNTYFIVARKMGKHLENISDSFTDIHRLYHNSIKFYALAWFKENADDEDPAADKYYSRFERTAQQAAQTLLRTKRPTSWKVIRHG